MEPIYRSIEFCRDPETLWGKMREGRWEWLGVHPEKQFVLGSPRRSGVFSQHGAATKIPASGAEGVHGTRVFTEPRDEDMPSTAWFDSPEEADADFSQQIEEFKSREGPILVKLELVKDGRVADREFVVKRPPTYQ